MGFGNRHQPLNQSHAPLPLGERGSPLGLAALSWRSENERPFRKPPSLTGTGEGSHRSLFFLGFAMAFLFLLTPAWASTPNPNPETPPTYQVILHGQRFLLEDTPTLQAKALGLMYRDRLRPRHGMVFRFDKPQPIDFWMKNCRIPLDMIFIRDSRVVSVVHAAPPCRKEICPLYEPPEPVDMVIELAGGAAKRLKLRTGEPVTFSAYVKKGS